MKTNISIRKVLVVIAWLAIGSGLLTLLAAANRKEQKHFCKDVTIRIKGIGDIFYIDKGDIVTILKNGSDQKLIGQPLNKMNLARMEKLLEKSSWVADAELYFDSHDVLHITATERQPIARIFTKAGTSYYIDSAAKRMPLLQKMSIRVPLVTNFPASKKMGPRDSTLLKDVKELTTFISQDPFWNAQVAQIDIVSDKNFELIPTIGNHIIRIGSADALEEKLNRLFVFYKNVLSKTGFDHYSVIDVQYKDQVVATQKGTVSKVDALQLQKNIEELMKKAQQAQEAQQPMVIDSTNQLQVNNSHEAFDAAQTQESIEKPDLPNPFSITEITTTKLSPTLKETTVKSKTIVKKKEVKKSNGMKPKAVMRPSP